MLTGLDMTNRGRNISSSQSQGMTDGYKMENLKFDFPESKKYFSDYYGINEVTNTTSKSPRKESAVPVSSNFNCFRTSVRSPYLSGIATHPTTSSIRYRFPNTSLHKSIDAFDSRQSQMNARTDKHRPSQLPETSKFVHDEEIAGRPVEEDASKENSKIKISPLQRKALDAIFKVTEHPSKTLINHIASELGLHAVSIKNFFANSRRRMRRAAAKLNDPEKALRENQRRKDKKRLASTVAATVEPTESPPLRLSVEGTSDYFLKESNTVSPERKALMEKLADKLQRSAAQRSAFSSSEGEGELHGIEKSDEDIPPNLTWLMSQESQNQSNLQMQTEFTNYFDNIYSSRKPYNL